MEKSLKPGRLIKALLVKEYLIRFKGSSAFFVTDFGGLTNKDMEVLRKKLRPLSGKYLIVKNSLCRLAFEELKMKEMADIVTGSCALSYGRGDPVSMSKVLVGFSNENKNLKLKGGYIEGEILTADGIKELASLPSREVLLARFVSCINSPIVGIVLVCSNILKKFLYALNEIAKKKEE